MQRVNKFGKELEHYSSLGSPRLWILYFVLFRCDHIQWRHRILERSARGDKFCRNCGPRNRFLDWYYQMATPSNQEVEPKAKQE
jgi:hypothetical protein